MIMKSCPALCACLLLSAGLASAQTGPAIVSSPDVAIQATFSTVAGRAAQPTGGQLVYEVTYRGKPMIEFFSHELLNLLARAAGHYRIIPKSAVSQASFDSLRAVIYPDTQPPPPALRKQILTFVAAGGMLITGPQWGKESGTPVRAEASPRFSLIPAGKGKIAMADGPPDDPYVWASDTVVLVSHRYDLVRFWNSGSALSYCAISPDHKQAVAHLLFYANRGPDSATVRIAGHYRAARASTVEKPELSNVGIQQQADAVEVHLAPVSQYVILELQV